MPPQRGHRRQMRKAIGFKALHAPAFVVHGNQQIGAHSFDGGALLDQLRAALPVACKQNHAAHQRVRQARLIGFAQTACGGVDDEGRVLNGAF